MLADLVNRLFRLLDDNVKLPLQLTEDQKRYVKRWGEFAGGEDSFVGTQIARRRYFGVVLQLLESNGGYEAFSRWRKVSPGWSRRGAFSNREYLRTSQEILQATSVDVLRRYSDLLKELDSLITVFSGLDNVYTDLVSKGASKVVTTTHSPQIFDLWANLLLRSAEHSNGTSFGKGSEIAKYLEQTDFLIRRFGGSPGILEKLLATATSLSESGVKPQSFFEACEYAHARLDSPEFTRWLNDGLQLPRTRNWHAAVDEYASSVRLEDEAYVLHLYARALVGRELILEPMEGHQNMLNLPCTDGITVWLPSEISGYGSYKDNMQAYMAFTASQAAKIEFGTFFLENADIQNLIEQLKLKYGTKAQGKKPLQLFFNAFPSPELAQTLFELIEDNRIITRLQEGYKGLSATLDAVIKRQFEMRPLPDGKAGEGLIVLEAFAHYLTLNNAPPAVPAHLRQSLNLIYNLALQAITLDADVVSSLKATAACYELFKPFKFQFSNKEASQKSEEKQATQTAADKFEGILEQQIRFLDFQLRSRLSDFTVAGRGYFSYPEWNVFSGEYNSTLCHVTEVSLEPVTNVPQIPISKAILHRSFAEAFAQRHGTRGHSEKIKHEPQGDDINLDAAIEFVTDFKAGVSTDPNIYIQLRKRPQGIAAAFLIDASPSTLFMLHHGNRVIDAERESLELLVTGLVQAEHTFGIFGFTGAHKDNVRVSIIKHFNDKFDRGRLYALDPVSTDELLGYEQPDLETVQGLREAMEFNQRSIIGMGTYIGPAVRHITHLLSTLPSHNKVLFVLTDSEPSGWVSCSGKSYEGQYARVDVNKAFDEAMRKGVRPFAISFGGKQEYLREMYGSDFVVISDAADLVQKLPSIYVNITR